LEAVLPRFREAQEEEKRLRTSIAEKGKDLFRVNYKFELKVSMSFRKKSK